MGRVGGLCLAWPYISVKAHMYEIEGYDFVFGSQVGMFQSDSQAKHRDQVPVSVIRAEFGEFAAGLGGLACPNRGCRAPEVAAGVLYDILDLSFQMSLAALTIKWRPKMSAAAWASYLQEFSKGKAHVTYIVTIKTSNWQELQGFWEDETFGRQFVGN